MQLEQITTAAARAAPVPPVVVGVTDIVGMIDWDVWVKVFTVLYLIVLTGYNLWKWRRESTSKKGGDE